MSFPAPYNNIPTGFRSSRTWKPSDSLRSREEHSRLFRRWKELAIAQNEARKPLHLQKERAPPYTPEYIPHDRIAQIPAMEPVKSVRDFEDWDYSSRVVLHACAPLWTAFGVVCLSTWFLWLARNSARPLDYVVSIPTISGIIYFAWKTFAIETILVQDILPAVKNGVLVSGQVPVIYGIPA